jgi:hypothetical protein
MSQPSHKIWALGLFWLVWRGGRTDGGVGFRTGVREPAVNRISKVELHFEEASVAVRSPKVRPRLKEASAVARVWLGLEFASPMAWLRSAMPVVLGDDPLDRWRSSLSSVSPAAQPGRWPPRSGSCRLHLFLLPPPRPDGSTMKGHEPVQSGWGNPNRGRRTARPDDPFDGCGAAVTP